MQDETTQTGGDAIDQALAQANEDQLRLNARVQIQEVAAHNAEQMAKNINSLSDAQFRRHVLETYGFFPGV
jgi:hypothetical protein